MPNRAEWLLKALHEAAGELESKLLDASDPLTRDYPVGDDLSLVEITRQMRDREIIGGWHLEQLVFSRLQTLKLHDLEWLSLDTDDRPNDVELLLHEYASARRRNCGLLWNLGPYEWQRSANHPFMGTISVEDVAVALHEHDIEHMWRAGRVTKALAATPRKA